MSMSPEQGEPDPGAVERQRGQRRRWSRRTTIVASAVAAAIGLVALTLMLGTRPGETASTDTGISVTKPGVPKVDYVIDLNTRVMTPLPKAIIRSLGNLDERGLYPSWGTRYAASHDGSQLAYVGAGDEGSPQIFIAGVDGTGVRQVTDDPLRASSPDWSPDATMIAYVASGASSCSMSPRASPPRLPTRAASCPRPSPSSRRTARRSSTPAATLITPCSGPSQ